MKKAQLKSLIQLLCDGVGIPKALEGDTIENAMSCNINILKAMTEETSHALRSASDMLDNTRLQGDFIKDVQQRGAAVLKARDFSSAASAVLDTLSKLNSTPVLGSNNNLSIALVSRGEYGIEEGLIFSFLCRVANGVVEVY